MTSNAPSADRLRHAETIEAPRVDASSFRQGWRVRTRLDALLADGRIDDGVWRAAVEYRAAWERVLAGGGSSDRPLRVMGGVSDGHARMAHTLATLTRLRRAEQQIGDLAAWLCVRCAVEDQSWAWSARQLHRNPETVRDWTAGALRGLAAIWWGLA